LAALGLLAAAAAPAADYPFSKWSEQFSRWKSRPLQGAYDRMVSGGPDGSTLVTFPYEGGAMRSLDGGNTWETFSIDGQGAGDVAIAPRDQGLWYAYGGRDRTLHRTADGGKTWSTHGDPVPATHSVSALAVSADADVLFRLLSEIQVDCGFICIGNGATLQRSTDAGKTWRDIGSVREFDRVFPSPTDPKVVFALGRNRLQRSLDQGTTWKSVSLPFEGVPPSLAFGSMVFDRFAPGLAYFTAGTTELSTPVFVTRDGGETWTSNPLPGGRLYADGAQPGRAYLFTYFFGAYETRDAGLTWTKLDPSVYTSINSNVAGVVLRGGRRFAVGPYFNTLRELELDNGALALTSDLWWKPDESGWGLSITHRASTQTFVAWYTYDDAGNAVWRVVPGGTWSDRTFSGDLYEASASGYFGGAFNPASVARRKVGTAQISFDSEERAVFSYRLATGASGAKRIERQRFVPPATVPVVQESYADLWWNPAESGWGIAINHQGNNIFATWFAYDDAGRPLWLVMPDAKVAVVNGVPTAAGDVYATHGPASSGSTFDPSQVVRTKVGTATLAFGASDRAELSSNVFGRAESRVIVRQPF
jgi:photosystem II stability/assembly factor-like uncharacterized protein